MRKIVLATASAAALTLAACSGGSEDQAEAPSEGTAAEASPVDVANSATGQDAGAASGATLDANNATATQLAGAGLSTEAAEAVVAGRPYATVVDLDAKLRETLPGEAAGAALENVFVPVNLNSASEDEIKLIPGMTDRMVHEFLEYRPYVDMAEFDREIGKYVDEGEVARFRRYVTL